MLRSLLCFLGLNIRSHQREFGYLEIFIEHDVRWILVERGVPDPSHELPSHNCLGENWETAEDVMGFHSACYALRFEAEIHWGYKGETGGEERPDQRAFTQLRWLTGNIEVQTIDVNDVDCEVFDFNSIFTSNRLWINGTRGPVPSIWYTSTLIRCSDITISRASLNTTAVLRSK